MNFKLAPGQQIIQKSKIGTCPHGLPMGACPICNGMGGGGGGNYRTTRRAAGEMTWDECAVVGQMLKAQRLAQQKRDLAMQAQINAPLNTASKLENLAQKIGNISEKIADFAQKIQSRNIPKILTQPLVIATKIAVPILNVLKEIPLVAQKAISFVQEKFADISDKLSAIFGELKNSNDKKISEKFKDVKKKFKSIFGIFEPTETDDEDKKIEEAKRLFDLKTTLENIKEKFTTKK